jgi:hypothetical protein
MDQDSQQDYGTAKWVEREDAHARHVIGTTKLVVTFSAAIAATFVSVAMQANDRAFWSETAAVLMLFVLLITLRVVLKQKSELDPEKVEGKSPEVVQAALKAAASADKDVAQSAHRLMVWQVRLSVLSSLAAAIALFIGPQSR